MLVSTNRRSSSGRIIIPSVTILILVIIAACVWTYATREWNASGTQKAGSPYSTAPSEGGKPLLLNK